MAAVAEANGLERARGAVRARIGVAHLVLAGLVAVSIAVRGAIAWTRAMPMLFPDEYTYSTLAKSLAGGHLPLIRGHNPHFSALLEPIATAPAWMVRDVATAFHLAQTVNVVAFSLVAVPVFLLARRVGASERLALGVAALALVVPDALYASFLIAEPLAYPLALASTLAGVTALEHPTRRRQVAFVVLAGLTTFARLQFVVLPVAFLAASAIVAGRERRLRQTFRQHRVFLVVSLVGTAAIAGLGVGFYREVLKHQLGVVPYVEAAATNAYLLLFVAGFAIVPGAAIGFWLALSSPRSRAELAFAAFSLPLIGLLLVESGFYGHDPHERYVFYGAPLLAVGFALYAARGWPYRLAHALAATIAVTLATIVPLTVLGEGKELAHSPILLALQRFEQTAGTPGGAAVLPLGVAVVGCLLAVGLSYRPRLASAAAVGVALLLVGGFCVEAVRLDRTNTERARAAVLPAERSWVDAAGVSSVPLLASPGVRRMVAHEQLFWNRSIDRVYVLPGAHAVDAFQTTMLGLRPDGTLLADGKTVRGPVVVDRGATRVRFQGERLLARGADYDLVLPAGEARLALYFVGLYRDGYIAPEATLRIWPRTSTGMHGVVRLTLRLPAGVSVGSSVEVRVRGRAPLHTRLQPGRPLELELPACTRGVFEAALSFGLRGSVGDRPVSARATAPTYTPDPAACAAAGAPTL